MAGACVGPGLKDGPDGIELFGPRDQRWPGIGPGCSVDAINGLRVDPVTEKLWAPPDLIIDADGQAGVHKVVSPTQVGDTTLTSLHVERTGFACRRTFWLAELTGGIALFRLGTGNFWTVKCASTIRLNGQVPIFGFGAPYVNTLENNSGGYISVGGATPNIAEHYWLDPGDKITLDVVFTLSVLTYNPSPLNGLTWDPPGLTGIGWSVPLLPLP